MAGAGDEVYCTLLTSDAYLPGVMVLAHSLRDHATKKQLAVLITPESLQAQTIEELRSLFDHIISVNRIINKSPSNLYLMNRPDLTSTFTKIALWRQTQFKHVVYIDADVVALRAPDELFTSPPTFAAAPDIGWPDCFNSGVLSLKPNMGDYYALLALAQRGISFDGADQGLLNMHFRNWERLGFAYNCTPSGNYQYVPAYRHFQSSISMVHYIGQAKPWMAGREQARASGVYEELLGRWWAVFDKHYRSPERANAFGRTSGTVQQYVKDEDVTAAIGGISVSPKGERALNPESLVHAMEPSLIYQTDPAEETTKGEAHPNSTAQRGRFSVDWDPIHAAPPTNSRPEAANFPQEIYNMSADHRLFQAPKTPEPPRNLYYQVPTTPSANERPTPIFPWESNQPKATRVFADDVTASAPSVLSETTPSVTTDDDETDKTISPPTPTMHSNQTEPFARFTRTNAWDEVPEIEQYISSLPQHRRAKVQVLFDNTTPSSNEPILSPPLEDSTAAQQRRPSMKLTDFPTEIERPSLPVTPAPIRRPSFWGAERDAAGELPGAEGVPEQSQWDPTTKLAELQRRQSEVLEKGSASSPGRPIPDRQLPGSASMPAAIAEEGEAAPAGAPPPVFGRLNFAGGPALTASAAEEVAPTES